MPPLFYYREQRAKRTCRHVATACIKGFDWAALSEEEERNFFIEQIKYYYSEQSAGNSRRTV